MNNIDKDVAIIEENDLFEVTSDTPFVECFACRSFCRGCAGPNIMSLGVEGACDFLQRVRIFLNKSYQNVADGTGISIATVKRTLTKKVGEPNFYTIAQINIYLMGSGVGVQRPCAIPNVATDNSVLSESMRDLERALGDNAEYKTALDNIHNSYKEEMAIIRNEAQNKVDYLVRLTEFLQKQLENKDEQLMHRKFAMQEKQQIIEWQHEDIVVFKAEIAELKAQIKDLNVVIDKLREAKDALAETVHSLTLENTVLKLGGSLPVPAV